MVSASRGTTHASSPGRRCLSGDKRELAKRIHGHKRWPFRVLLLLAADSGERFLQIRVEARGISKRRVEYRFHIGSHSEVGIRRKFAAARFTGSDFQRRAQKFTL
jgi:hypothetical protein